MCNLGFKKITADNWREKDEINSYFKTIYENGKSADIDMNKKVDAILEPKLNEKVPLEVKQLFEVARGAIIYGYFFYPLYALGMEQLFRVRESAVHFKCSEIGEIGKNFHRNIDILNAYNIIEDKELWHSIREIRNEFSHANMQEIIPLNVAIQEINSCVKDINSLFI
ncbi:hypothetical protein [Clostridium akagii]|uniref:hypothetical protein n=1 Tax=Clostridium akagii TaxID=91623 RepID=UPI00047C2F43|nr:hypothetical protein [Clostridium akagii]